MLQNHFLAIYIVKRKFNKKRITLSKLNLLMSMFKSPIHCSLMSFKRLSMLRQSAMRMYNAKKNKQSRSSVHWKNLAGISPQPSNKECGYFIMRYMRDIIGDKDMSLFPSKWERRGNSQYTQADINQVRNEWGKFVVNTYVHES